MSEQNSPREPVIRAVFPAVEFRDARESDLEDGHLGLLRILFSPVNEWTEINSAWEGNFLERFAPGAWKKTISERASKIRSLFQHGMDPQIGDKPLGPIRLLEENDRGGYAEVPMLDTSYNRDLLPGIKAGLYGASHRFAVMREEEVSKPEPSDHNPKGLPEHTVKEAQLFEFGPVTFPAYAGATAAARSLTDDFLMRCFERDPEKLRAMFETANRSAGEQSSQELLEELTAEIKGQTDFAKTASAADVYSMARFLQDVISRQMGRQDGEAEEPDGTVAEPHLAEQRPVKRTTPRPSLTSTRGVKFTLDQKESAWRLP